MLSLKSVNIISHRQKDVIFHGVGSQCQLEWPDTAAKMQFSVFTRICLLLLPRALHYAGANICRVTRWVRSGKRSRRKVNMYFLFCFPVCLVIFQLDLNQNQVPHVAMQMLLPKQETRQQKHRKNEWPLGETAPISSASYLQVQMKLWSHSLAGCAWFPHIFPNAHSAVDTALPHLVHHTESYLQQGTEGRLAPERSSPPLWEDKHYLPIHGLVELHHQGGREDVLGSDQYCTLSTQLSSGAANLAVLPGGQGMRDSGMPVDQVCEVKQLSPFAEASTTGKPKESALWQPAMLLQYETAVHIVWAYDPTGSECASPCLSRGLPWTTFLWLNKMSLGMT